MNETGRPVAPLRAMVAGATDVGRKRSHNEDSYAVLTADRDGGPEAVLVLCDGMGGSNAGEVASRMAADTVVRVFRELERDDVTGALQAAVQAANREVWDQSRSHPAWIGMGTTCTAAVVRDRTCVIAHAGDSRAYLIREGKIRQLTTDHSLVAQLVARGELTPEEARLDRRRNVVTRSVGVEPTLEVEIVALNHPLQPGDILLLCSDGLHGQVRDEELADLGSGYPLESACRDLVALADDRGGPDNITVILARLETMDTSQDEGQGDFTDVQLRDAASYATDRSRTRRLLVLAIVAMLVALVLLAGLLLVSSRRSG